MVSPDTPVQIIQDLISQPPPTYGWPENWSSWPNVREAHRRTADEFHDHIPPYPRERFSGSGVAVVGGGPYWASAYVCVRMMRAVGVSVPIQVWHAPGEADPVYAELLKPHGAEIVDAGRHPAAGSARLLTGFPDPTKRRGPFHPIFQLKTFAALHSPFERVVIVDADVYPASDPFVLFDHPEVKESGGLYWPDFPPTEDWTHWADWGVAPRGWACGLETGQYLLDKRLAWRPLNMARHYDDHGDCYYGWGMTFGHGDKEPHRIGWARCGQDPTVFYCVPDWNKIGFIHYAADRCTPVFVHRCRSKFGLALTEYVSSPQDGLNLRAGAPGEDQAFGFLEELKELTRGR